MSNKGQGPNQQQIDLLVGLFSEGRIAEAANFARRLTTRYPNDGVCWKALGAALASMGKIADAIGPLKKAAGRLPHDAEAHGNLANALREVGEFDAAVASCHHALKLSPGYAAAYVTLGNSLVSLGRLDEAIANYGKAVSIAPDFADALCNLAVALSLQGEWSQAFNTIWRALQIHESPEAKSIFCTCLKRMRFSDCNSAVCNMLIRALMESWDRPCDLSMPAVGLLNLDQGIGERIDRAVRAWAVRASLPSAFQAEDMAALGNNRLLCVLLASTPVADLGIERLLTMMRLVALDVVTGISCSHSDAMLTFCSALAQQCFINEYIYWQNAAESKRATELRQALEQALAANADIPPLWLVVVGAYSPLSSLSFASQLLSRPWPDSVMAVLRQQIIEPAEEARLRTTMSRLVNVDDRVSLLVQNQYEENPYPRWIRACSGGTPRSLSIFLRRKFPLSKLRPIGAKDGADVLIAGCGTGEQSIETAARIQGSRLLAIDLSMSSLCYAQRKTNELGLTSIKYLQGDLLNLGSLDQTFDAIESVGVLHHLADPWTGWRVLLSRLRPCGVMRLGFYSRVARRHIIRIQSLISERRIGSTADDIRRYRQDLLTRGDAGSDCDTLKSGDFFAVSTCRDLLFHVQEHCMLLPEIATFIRENSLAFIGFDLEPDVLRAYKQRFRDDRDGTNLDNWEVFENENPDTFIGMYQFWVQKLA